MKIKWKVLIICIAIPLIVGGISGFITMGAMEDFSALEQPPLSPPGWLFPVVWAILYTLMGVASYLVVTSGGPQKQINTAITATNTFFIMANFTRLSVGRQLENFYNVY